MKRFLTVFALLCLSLVANAEPFTISDMRLEGLQRVSSSPVFAAMPIQVGDTVDAEDIRQTMQSVFNTGFFTNIQVARDGNVLILILQERPAIKEINIEGNKVIKTEQLTQIMDDNGLSEGEILERHMLEGITRELEKQYISQARYGAKVKTDVEDLANNMVKINIDVDEGKAAKIRHINFVGNRAFSDEELLENFELSTAKWSTIFNGKHRYAKEKLKGDIEKLESFYLNRGYLDFDIVSSQVSVSPDKKSVYMTFNVSEGDIYTIKTIDILGDPILSEASIRRIILFHEGDTFSQQRMTATAEYISNLLGNAGYTNADVKGVPEKVEGEANTIALNFFINPGKRVYVRRIDFKGNTKTSDEVLRREMRQIEGASASNSRIEQSKVRLERLGYFKEVNVETKDVPGTEDLLDVEYTVEEQPSGSITASLGYAQYSGLNLGVNVQENNWMGTGKTIGFGINKNIYMRSYSFSYDDPYFTPDGVSRGFNLFYQSRDYAKAGIAEYSTDSYGGGVSFGYPISEISRIKFGVGLINQKVATGDYASQEIQRSPYIGTYSDVSYITYSDYLAGDYSNQLTLFDENDELRDVLYDFDDTEPGFVEKYGNEYDSATFNVAWSRFALNRGVLADRGTSQTLSLNGTIPGSDLEYAKLTYDAQAFYPLGRHFTLRFRTTLGYGEGYGSMEELPFFENFYAGGFGSVRGFKRSTLGPQSTDPQQYVQANSVYLLCDSNPSPSGLAYISNLSTCEPGKLIRSQIYLSNDRDSFGGNILMEFGSELILPIPFIKDTRSMQLVAFVDAGNVFSSSCRDTQVNCHNVDFQELSSSVGFGFTWLSSFGPMTFSLAKALHQSVYDEREVFQFTFGTGF